MLNLRRDHFSPSRWCSSSKEDLQAAVQWLKDNSIPYVGPFVIESGFAVFRVSDCVLTADELVDLHKSGLLTPEGLTRFAEQIQAQEEQRAMKPGR